MKSKKIVAFLFVSFILLSLGACSSNLSYDKIVTKVFTAIDKDDYTSARQYFGDTLGIYVGETALATYDNANGVDNYVADLIAKDTNIANTTMGTVSADNVTATVEKKDTAMEIAGIPNENAQMTFYFTDNKITKIVYANRDEYNANYTKYQGGGGMFYAQVQSDNSFKVSQVTKDGPAQKAGLLVGDIITAIDSKSCSDMNAAVGEQSIRCRGEVGKSVTLSVTRVVKNETKTLDITYTRVAI